MAAAVLAGLGLVTSCNITGGSSGETGGLNLLVTDGPTDEWSQVTVILKSISIHHRSRGGWETIWTAAEGTKTTLNLVDLNGISDLLGSLTDVPTGTYDRIKIGIDYSEITLVPADSDTPIDKANITVIDPRGNGEITVEMDDPVTVEAGKFVSLQVDFDLAHPLSIVNLDGKIIVNLRIRHKRLPRDLMRIQFARTLGTVTGFTDATTDKPATFTLKTIKESTIEFFVDAETIYVNVDDPNATANFDGLKLLKDDADGGALVSSTMKADGSLYARRVWYSTDLTKLPDFSPEGLVRRVGDNWISIMKMRAKVMPTSHGRNFRCPEWNSETVFINADTEWYFKGDATTGVRMRTDADTGLDILKYISRGYRVEVLEYVDPEAYPKYAKIINVQSAHREGIVMEPTDTGFTLGWFWHHKDMLYSAVVDHEFGWWFYGLDANRSEDTVAFKETVTAAKDAHLWVFAWADLYWDTANKWVVEDLVLAPMKLHDFTKITGNYGADTANPKTMQVSTYNCWDWSTPEVWTIKLDDEADADLQTIVGSFVWNSGLVTFTLPVLPADWGKYLTTEAKKVKIWVRPVKEGDTFTWHAYSVLVYYFVND
jgi:hypothetical protein